MVEKWRSKIHLIIWLLFFSLLCRCLLVTWNTHNFSPLPRHRTKQTEKNCSPSNFPCETETKRKGEYCFLYTVKKFREHPSVCLESKTVLFNPSAHFCVLEIPVGIQSCSFSFECWFQTDLTRFLMLLRIFCGVWGGGFQSCQWETCHFLGVWANCTNARLYLVPVCGCQFIWCMPILQLRC